MRLRLRWLACAMGAVLYIDNIRPLEVPVVDLPPALSRFADPLGNVLSVRETSIGTVLVDDGRNRWIRVGDTTLARLAFAMHLMDSSGTYGLQASPLLAYFGDSSLLADYANKNVRVLDAQGRVGRVIAPPDFTGIQMLFGTNFPVALDDKGRLLTRGFPPPSEPSLDPHRGDFMSIIRFDNDGVRRDTLGRVRVEDGVSVVNDRTNPERMKSTWTIHPLPEVDDWAVISDGSVALVRGHDYHIDWIRNDGRRESSAKMPFTWVRVTESEKRRMVDSLHAETARMWARFSEVKPGVRDGPHVPEFVVVDAPLNQITDYWPALTSRSATAPGSTRADCDNNLWILPAHWGPVVSDTVVYDVVNSAGRLFERVRVTGGRRIVAFAKGGVVYLVSGDSRSGYFLERTRLPGGAARESR